MSPERVSHEDVKDHASNYDAEYTHDPVASRTASTAPKSLMSKSSFSRPGSSASSAMHANNNGGSALPALQTRAYENDGLEPLAEEEIDPASFDLVVPAHAPGKQYSLEVQSEQLFSHQHLGIIFEDPVLLQRFTNFIYQLRPESVPLLQYYLDVLKALKAIDYANAVVGGLQAVDDLPYTAEPVDKTLNRVLREKANKAFETLATEELPAYITYTYIQTVTVTIKRRIADTLPSHLREMSEGLAEVFCLTDPARPDNPIIFASEEFHRTTQYGMSYVLGRNCRFLQGPKTNPFSVKRIRDKLAAGREHSETFLNYRRDGSPFMNLLMVAPLFDSRGVVRYHIGAQVDVSGLVRDCAGLESLARLVDRENEADGSAAAEILPVRIHGKPQQQQTASAQQQQPHGDDARNQNDENDDFRELASMFSLGELKTVREHGGSYHRIHQAELTDTDAVGGTANWAKPRLLIKDDATVGRRSSDPLLQTSLAPPTDGGPGQPSRSDMVGGRLSGVYEHYLLVRPYPSLRILFASPRLRVPGMLQSNLMSRIGGSPKVREAIAQAFCDGNGVTAKVRWTTGRTGGSDRGRWMHCTPLLGSNGAVGVWMVVLVDDEQDPNNGDVGSRDAPPVDRYISSRGASNVMSNIGAGGSVDNLSLTSFGDGGLNDRDLFGAPEDDRGAGDELPQQQQQSQQQQQQQQQQTPRGRTGGGGYGYESPPSSHQPRGGTMSAQSNRRTPALNGLAMHDPRSSSDPSRRNTPDTVRTH
ncbi:hypothetical protein E8E14_005195 [Neopestalotiopsis sp. 37M]|nr:hypothetical protein E8E14_005195 [Neopestalotiopsis sp. 37M]